MTAYETQVLVASYNMISPGPPQLHEGEIVFLVLISNNELNNSDPGMQSPGSCFLVKFFFGFLF